jgi:hypothetical protein
MKKPYSTQMIASSAGGMTAIACDTGEAFWRLVDTPNDAPSLRHSRLLLPLSLGVASRSGCPAGWRW